MPSTSTCAKCKKGAAQEGDTWCLGCSALDLAQDQLRLSWHSIAVRVVAEECILSCARLVKAFSNLDRGLAAQDAAQLRANASTAPKAAPTGTRPRSRSRGAEERGRAAEPRAPPPPAPLPTGDSYEEYSESEAERDEDREAPAEVRRAEKAAPARSGDHHRHSQSGRPGDYKKKKTRLRRGGKKHQRASWGLTDPFRRVHKRLPAETLKLAPNFRAGLERRA